MLARLLDVIVIFVAAEGILLGVVILFYPQPMVRGRHL